MFFFSLPPLLGDRLGRKKKPSQSQAVRFGSFYKSQTWWSRVSIWYLHCCLSGAFPLRVSLTSKLFCFHPLKAQMSGKAALLNVWSLNPFVTSVWKIKNLYQHINQNTEASFIGKSLLPRQKYVSGELHCVLRDVKDSYPGTRSLPDCKSVTNRFRDWHFQ